MSRTSLTRAAERVNDLLHKAALVLLGDDGKPAPPERQPTGIDALDAMLGGGFVRGRLVEIFGPPGGGKTALSLALIAGMQRAGGSAAFIDVEGTLDPTRAAAAGVDLTRLVAARPSVGEEALQMVDALLKARAVDVVVVDSVAALVPREEMRLAVGESPAGLHARLMSQSLRRLVAVASTSRANVIFLNQTRTNFDDDGKGFMTTTGGQALHFYAATRLEVKRRDSALFVRVVKDRFGAEGKVAVLPWATSSLTSM